VAALTSPSANDRLNEAIVEQLDCCLAALSGGDESSTERVHTARKRLKRARALLALRRNQKPFLKERKALRLVAHSLGRVRDAAAIAHTWSSGGERISEPARNVVTKVLAEHQARASASEREIRHLARAKRVLTPVRTRLALTLEREPKQSSEQLEHALRAAYRKARRELRRAASRRSAVALHALRRAAKRHQYQLQFLEPLWKRPLKAQRKELARLTDLLGSHHDLSAIEELVNRAQREALDDAWHEQLNRWRDELLGGSLELARVALAESAHGFERRVHRLFEAQPAAPE
jgi:CHAD domain-containing protein